MANVRVAVRVRPLSGREADSGARNIVTVNGNSLSITNTKVASLSEYGDSRDRVKHFTFDYCYDSNLDRSAHADYASQELVYQDLGTEVLQAAFDGYNACLFAYGQTGTGKTFTMMGYPGEIGLTPRICEGLFGHVDDCPEENITFRVEISYLEIYKERVRDLLQTSHQADRFTLKVREHPKEGPYVQDLTRHKVKDYHEIQTLLDRGNQYRTTASTHMHEHSSRSHAIVTISFTQAKLEDGMPSETVSKVHLVDLAGSERADPNYHANYKGRIAEGANINKSLYTLGNVIKALAERSLLAWSTDTMGSSQSFASSAESQGGGKKSRPLYIPYRDSVLTWLLKDSLGGNSKTLMIATITPASQYYSETISTLRYAQRAKSIVNQPRINEDVNVSLIRQLRQEIERLKQMLASARMSHSPQLNEILYLLPGADRFLSYNQSDIESDEGGAVTQEQEPGASLKEKLKENEAMANQLTQSWLNKWNETQTLMQDTDLSIRGLGRRTSSYGVIIDSQLPHLIGMDDDILSTGVIIYHLKVGKTLIGREDARREQDIVLEGLGIQSEHCHVKNEGGQVTLFPHHGAQCTVNGVLIHEPTPLTQGDVLLLGKTNMYRFNNPAQAAKLRQHRQSLQDGELLSASSSFASLSDTELSRATPLGMYNPNLELENAYANEDERIKHARSELERVRTELSVREEEEQEKEEDLWAEHEKHREEVEAEKIRLAHHRDRLLRMEEDALVSLSQQRHQLQENEEKYKQDLQQKLGQLMEETKKRKRDSTGQQTDLHPLSSSAIQTEQSTTTTAAVTTTMATACAATDTGAVVKDAVFTGLDGHEIQQRKQSVEGKMKGLVQTELLQTFSHRQAVQELESREEEMEEEIQQSRGEIETRIQQIHNMEEQYRHADTSKLDQIRQQKEQLEELHRQEEQLELYLEEKQDLKAVGQAQPQPLRGAHSELFLAGHGVPADILTAHALRATSETNVGDYDNADISNLAHSDTEATDSRESLEILQQSTGFYLHADSEYDLSQSIERLSSESMEMLRGHRGSSSQSLGSELDSDEMSSGALKSAEGCDFVGGSSSSRGRTRMRSGRGKAIMGQSQGQGKPDAAEERKLTSPAVEVTSRLYQLKSSPTGIHKNFLRSKRDKTVTATSSSPPVRKSPSPKPSSKSLSPGSPLASRKVNLPKSQEALDKKSRNRDEWERPWRTKPETVDTKHEDSEHGSPSHRSLDRNRENWERPWRQTTAGSKPTRPAQAGSQGMADRKGAGKDIKGTADETRKADSKRKGKSSGISPTHSASGKQSLRGDESGEGPTQSRKSLLKGSSQAGARDSGRQDSSTGRKQRLGGSDSSLVTQQRQQPYRPRSRIRQLSSASSLPSVPEAAAEGDSDLDSVPLTSEPSMAALVAAVPRRQRRGRQNIVEEEERRHSEPVGEKYAQALAQYTAEMESGMGREGLQRLERVSPASPLQWMDSIPQIQLTEASSSGTDGNSSQESVQPSQQASVRDVRPRELYQMMEVSDDHTDDSQCEPGVTQAPPVSVHKTGEKREHRYLTDQKDMTSRKPKKQRGNDERDDIITKAPTGKEPQLLVDSSLRDHEDMDQSQMTCDPPADLDESYSADSLDEGDDSFDSFKQPAQSHISDTGDKYRDTELKTGGIPTGHITSRATEAFILHENPTEGTRTFFDGKETEAVRSPSKATTQTSIHSTLPSQTPDTELTFDKAQSGALKSASGNSRHTDSENHLIDSRPKTGKEPIDQHYGQSASKTAMKEGVTLTPRTFINKILSTEEESQDIPESGNQVMVARIPKQQLDSERGQELPDTDSVNEELHSSRVQEKRKSGTGTESEAMKRQGIKEHHLSGSGEMTPTARREEVTGTLSYRQQGGSRDLQVTPTDQEIQVSRQEGNVGERQVTPSDQKASRKPGKDQDVQVTPSDLGMLESREERNVGDRQVTASCQEMPVSRKQAKDQDVQVTLSDQEMEVSSHQGNVGERQVTPSGQEIPVGRKPRKEQDIQVTLSTQEMPMGSDQEMGVIRERGKDQDIQVKPSDLEMPLNRQGKDHNMQVTPSDSAMPVTKKQGTVSGQELGVVREQRKEHDIQLTPRDQEMPLRRQEGKDQDIQVTSSGQEMSLNKQQRKDQDSQVTPGSQELPMSREQMTVSDREMPVGGKQGKDQDIQVTSSSQEMPLNKQQGKDQDSQVTPGSQEMPVNMLSLLAGEEEGSQLSDEGSSSSHVEKQIQAWQEVLHQLSPRTAAAQPGSNPSSACHTGNGRRGKRRPHSRHVKGSDSDNVDHPPGEELASGANSQPSSRPSSGSRRRRRPASKTADQAVKKHCAHSSEEYVSSDNNSIFSDESVTHSSERHDAPASRVPYPRAPTHWLTTNQDQCETLRAESPAQLSKKGNMEGEDARSVPALVSYFESQASHDQMDGREKSPGVEQAGRSQRELSVTSFHSDNEGSSSANEATQTEGGNVVLGKAPVSVLSAGDPSFVGSNGAYEGVSGVQGVQEVSSVGAQSRHSWRLSISPVDSWENAVDQQSVKPSQEHVQLRRKLKHDSNDNPEKRQRQDMLNVLHSKYGLMDEAKQLSDDDDLENSAAGGGQDSSDQQRDPRLSNKTSKKDSDGKLKFEVTINQDQTNVLYNIETTEYKTCSVKGGEGSTRDVVTVSKVPEAININLTETTTVQRQDHFETVTKERVIFDGKGSKENQGDKISIEYKYAKGHAMNLEQDREGSMVSRESSVERTLTDEDTDIKWKTDTCPEDSVAMKRQTDASESGMDVSHVHKASHSSSDSRSLSADEGRESYVDHHSSVLSSSPDVQSSSVAGNISEQSYDSGFPVNSTTTESSASELTTTHNEADIKREVNKSAASNSALTDVGFSSYTDIPKQVMWREDINNALQVKESGSVASQMHQTIAVHHDLPKQDLSRDALSSQGPHQEAASKVRGTNQQGQPQASPAVTSFLQVEQNIPDTPPPGTSKPPDNILIRSQVLDTHSNSVRSQQGVGSTEQEKLARDNPQNTSSEQAVAIPVIHLPDTVQLTPQTGLSSKNQVSASSLQNTGSKGAEKNDGNLKHGFIANSRSEQESKDSKETLPENASVRFFPADVWMMAPEKGIEQNNNNTESSVSMVVKQDTHDGLEPLRGRGSGGKESLGNDSVSHRSAHEANSAVEVERVHKIQTPTSSDICIKPQIGSEEERQQFRPSVSALPLEKVEQLPHTQIEYGPQPNALYPYCHDGLLLFTSTSCSEEPYSWIDNFTKESGIASGITSSPRKSRLESERAAETLLAEVKRRKSKGSVSDEEDVFFEEIVLSGDNVPAMITFQSRNEHHKEGVVHSVDPSIHDTDSSQDRQLTIQQNTSQVIQAGVKLRQTEEMNTVVASNESQRELCSTPLSQTILSTSSLPSQSSISSDSTQHDKAAALQSDDSVCMSTEESFHSAVTMHSGSDSSTYKTPQQSPRGQTEASCSLPPASDSGLLRAATRTGQESQGSEMLAAQTSALKAVVSAVGSQLVTGAAVTEVEAIREVLKREVERKIARLERRVRSLSDSAISSDFTDPESASVSPRSSRVPVSDINMESLASDPGYFKPPFFQQDVFFSTHRDFGDQQWTLSSDDKHREKHAKKSLEDSGNIHDNQWQDSSTDTTEDRAVLSTTPSVETLVSSDTFTQSVTPHDLTGATSTPNTFPSSQSSMKNVDQRLTDRKTELMSVDAHHHFGETKTCVQASSPTQRETRQSSNQFSKQVVGAVDSILSVQQSWPARAFESYSHRRKKLRGFSGRKTKSMDNLRDLAAAQEYNSLEENLTEQARLILQATTRKHAMDTTFSTTSRQSRGEDSVDNAATASLYEPKHGTSNQLRDVSNQAAKHTLNAAVSSSKQTSLQSSQIQETEVLSQNKPRILSEERRVFDNTLTETSYSPDDRKHGHQAQSPDHEFEDSASDLMTSGELEVAEINARATVRSIRPQQDADCSSRELSPGEEILADILARQFGVTSPSQDTSDRRLLSRFRFRGSSPLRPLPPRQEASVSHDELNLPQETVDHLEQAVWEQGEHETVEDLLNSRLFQWLDRESMTASQLKMLYRKALSMSSLDSEAHTSQEKQEFIASQMERPVSLACLEGLVMEDSETEDDSSVDSICFVFMGQKNPESEAQLQAMGGSILPSDQSEFFVSHSRSTESIPFDGEVHCPPFSERSASMDNIYSTTSSGIERTTQLHRSRSASLLDVATNTVCGTEMDESIFPPSGSPDSDTSLEGVHLENEEPFRRKDVSTITNPHFIHRASLVEPSSEHHLYLTSPTKLYTRRPSDFDTDKSWSGDRSPMKDGDASTPTPQPVPEVESGQPYFRYRTPGVRPQQSENGAQTEREARYRTSVQQTDEFSSSDSLPRARSQGTGSASAPGNASYSSGQRLPESPSRERWMELSHLMVETTQILQNLQQTFPSAKSPSSSQSSLPSFRPPIYLTHEATQTDQAIRQVPGPAYVSTGEHQREELELRVETGTQTPTLPSEPFSPQGFMSGYPQTIIIKVKDALTQTGSSLGDLSTVESQTEENQQLIGSIEGSLRPSTRDASSSIEGMMSLTDSMVQTDDQPVHPPPSTTTTSMNSQTPSANQLQSALILKKTRDASSSYDMLHTSDVPSQTDFNSRDWSDETSSRRAAPSNTLPARHPEIYSTSLDESNNIVTVGNRGETRKMFVLSTDPHHQHVSVCTQMSMDFHPRYIAISDLGSDAALEMRGNLSSFQTSREEQSPRPLSVDDVDQPFEDDRLHDRGAAFMEQNARWATEDQGSSAMPAVRADSQETRREAPCSGVSADVPRPTVALSMECWATPAALDDDAQQGSEGGIDLTRGSVQDHQGGAAYAFREDRSVTGSVMMHAPMCSEQSSLPADGGLINPVNVQTLQATTHREDFTDEELSRFREVRNTSMSSSHGRDLSTFQVVSDETGSQRLENPRHPDVHHQTNLTETSTSQQVRQERDISSLSSRPDMSSNKDRKLDHRPRRHEADHRYRMEERAEASSLPQFTRSRREEESYLLDSSMSDEDLFYTDAHQRAAWRARMGDFGLPLTSEAAPRMSRLTLHSSLGDSTWQERQRGFDSYPPVPHDSLVDEIDKLRQEHNRMMQLLERSRHRSTPLLSQLLRTRSASPRITHAGSGSSSSDSVVTVVAGRDHVHESAVTVPRSQSIPVACDRQEREAVHNSGLRSHRSTGHSLPSADSYPAGQLTGPVDRSRNDPAFETDTVTRFQAANGSILARSEFSSAGAAMATHNGSGEPSPIENGSTARNNDTTDSGNTVRALIDVPSVDQQARTALREDQSPMIPGSSERTVQLEDSPAVSLSLVSGVWSDSAHYRQHDLDMGGPLVDTPHISNTTDSHSTYSTARRQHAETSTRSAGEGYGLSARHHTLHPSQISTGVEAIVNLSDEFTQTDAEDDNSLMDVSRGSAASSSTSETHIIRAELDRLQQERVEIIELLSLQYLPGSVTVELLEAKLNYCLGQTDMLLSSLEKSWSHEEPTNASKRRRSRKHEEFLANYREQFEQSRRDLRVCMEEAQRIHSGARGRRKTRTRDVVAMRRRAQVEAFKEERRREQQLFDRHRNFSPDVSDASRNTSPDASDPGRKFAPSVMTPREHKEHLLRLRRTVVEASCDELSELRERSRSSSFSRSSTPDCSVSPVSYRSSVYTSRESSLGSSLSPSRSPAVKSSSLVSAYHSTLNQPGLRSSSAPTPQPSSPVKVPRLVLPSADLSNSHDYSFSRRSQSSCEPRSNSCGPLLAANQPLNPRYLAAPADRGSLHRGSLSSSHGDDRLDPEQLLRESYEARQLNRQQILKAQDALRMLEQHRTSFRSHIGSSQDSRYPSSSQRLAGGVSRDQAERREEDTYRQRRTQVSDVSHGFDSRSTPLLQDSNEPPESTSTPRTSDSFATYAKDILTRSERRIHQVIARSSGTSDEVPLQDSPTHRNTSPSVASRSRHSPEHDSFYDSPASSTGRSSRFTASRPISSSDIKARIARRMMEKSKTKK